MMASHADMTRHEDLIGLAISSVHYMYLDTLILIFIGMYTLYYIYRIIYVLYTDPATAIYVYVK